jgi:uncharacterized membrane protein
MMEQRPAPTVKWGEWINEGWQLFAAKWQVWVPMMLVFVVATLVPILPLYILIFSMNLATVSSDAAPEFTPLLPLLGGVGGLITLCLVAFMLGGVYRTAFKQMRGEPISVRDLFSAGDVFLPMLGALFLFGLSVEIGLAFCIVPGVLLAGLLAFTFPLIVEKRLGVIEAMQRSFEMTRPNMWMFALFAFVLWVIGLVGMAACYVGMLVTAPLQFLIMASAYKDCFGVSGARNAGALQSSQPAYPPQAYNQQSWSNQPPATYGQPVAPPPASQPRPFSPPAPPSPVAPPPPSPQPFTPPTPAAPPAQPPLVPTQVMPVPDLSGSTSPGELKSDQKLCPHCQAVLQRAANFCNFCGKPLRQ